MEGPEHQFPDYSGTASFPDLMNDPAYATNTKGKGRDVEDPDTCRICRGEGTEEEQLFYPCKCSGSIKFVHQACLVEWLSHSQKKHCELCKTPFRFTKLYDPNMPRNLPAPLFMKQLFIHSFRTMVTWFRFVLVAFVWLGWLPWSMRAIWRALFWLADGRWSGSDMPRQGSVPGHGSHSVEGVTGSLSSGAAGTASAVPAAILPGSSDASAPVPSMFGFSSGEPLMFSLIKNAFSSLFFPAMSSGAGHSDAASSNATLGLSKPRRSSWLSDVKFLNSLTPSPTFNNILIDTLEGQLITILVVVSCILIFLIREWVVQQQPTANIAEGEREAAVQLIANNRPNQNEDRPIPGQQPALEQEEAGLQGNARGFDDADGVAPPQESPRPFHGHTFIRDDNLAHPEAAEDFSTQHYDGNDYGEDVDPSTGQQYSQIGQVWPGTDIFRDLWSRAQGDPEQVLRLIREENREVELDWIVTAMTNLRQNRPPDFFGRGTATQRNEMAPGTDAYDAHTYDPQPVISESSQPAYGYERPEDYTTHWDASNSFNPEPEGSDHTERSQSPFAFNFPDPGSNALGQPEDDINPTQAYDGEPYVHEAPVATPVVAVAPAPVPAEPFGANDSFADRAGDIPESAPSSVPNDNPAVPTPPKAMATRVLDWFWADITPDEPAEEPPHEDGEHIIEDPALEPPFVPVQNNQRAINNAAQDNQGLLADAGLDPNDIEAIEDGDDLEGILELIGMHGPIFGLLQNGVFSALLISFTVAIGIWLPYLWGKIALVLLANPIQLVFGVPMTAVSVFADVTLDTLIGSLGYVMYWVTLLCKVFLSPLGALLPIGDWIPHTKSITSASLSLIDASSHRLKNVASAFFVFHEADVPMFSVLSHQALKIHQARIAALLRSIVVVVRFVLHDMPLRLVSHGVIGAFAFDRESLDLNGWLLQTQYQIKHFMERIPLSFNGTKWFKANMMGLPPAASITLDTDLAVWDTQDRVIAIVMGYLLVSALGLLYLRATALISGVARGQRVEGIIAEVLNQAGGVMKVILIIGIEMIVFPLYCGSLLDIALLPLFEGASITSRIEFTSSSPLTSLFVHWFIGTCYMFHFALFVAMCRKIMRSGVLYFIRDPDDPTFHPVRDVLERNITTQLRKIAFSALVYGALVIVCLGGVVWGLSFAFDGILPIHWSATIPVLEFPVDLLFYNFVMPLAIRSIKPSDGLHGLYNWWFHKCARFLRLTEFFFGDRQIDEEGYHVRRTWWQKLTLAKGDTTEPVHTNKDDQKAAADKTTDVYFARDGRFVRAPASDQVRIPKGSQVFLEVSESNERVDGATDVDEGLHGRKNDMFTKVYVPPFFRSRIAAFILLIWVFAAATGVGTTIIPLIVGRKLMSSYFPNRPLNDIYAFSIGICIVGGVVFVAWYCKNRAASVKDRLGPYLQSPRQACLGLTNVAMNGLRLIYIFTAFSVVLPSLFALVVELYVLVPVHTYLGGTQAHVIHFVQDWTLGVLYVQMAVKFVLWNSASRPAAALNGIFRDSWLKPNVNLATRALLLPITLLAAVAVSLPLCLGFILNASMFHSAPEVQSKVYRYAYPATLFMSLLLWLAYLVRRQVEIWRVNIRDDVYLIGERLHNFREKRARDVGVPRQVITG
ncbi:E3 ubiquitin-protein ligase SSM4 [Aspergillus melleus]|uniref:E3 ubiquitin-protein ligase SSM4 n=1 Tax=Aspergillus melleus TaxID=138277 RepID=UPI001E8EEF6F|nr:uncharacterized protein LDX57_003279 [Aspergillus melleus]KAH8425528.1 hypothetical protein LDX57_003279 [Aspergillus melleus]